MLCLQKSCPNWLLVSLHLLETPRRFDGLRRTMGGAYRAMTAHGVRFAAGTDAGAIPDVSHHQLLDGMLIFGELAAMSPAELLRAATSEAAAACRLQRVTGALIEGLAADLLVVPGDPLARPPPSVQPLAAVKRALSRPRLVVLRGAHVVPCEPPAMDALVPCRCTVRMRGGFWGDSGTCVVVSGKYKN